MDEIYEFFPHLLGYRHIFGLLRYDFSSSSHISSQTLTPLISIIITLFIALIYMMLFSGEKCPFSWSSPMTTTIHSHLQDEGGEVSINPSDRNVIGSISFLCALEFCVYYVFARVCRFECVVIVLSGNLRTFQISARFWIDIFLCSASPPSLLSYSRYKFMRKG